MVRWQIVVKRPEATKQTKDQTTTKQNKNKQKRKEKENKQPIKKANKNKTKEQQEQNRRMGAEGYKANNYSNVIINIDLRETHTEGEG